MSEKNWVRPTVLALLALLASSAGLFFGEFNKAALWEDPVCWLSLAIVALAVARVVQLLAFDKNTLRAWVFSALAAFAVTIIAGGGVVVLHLFLHGLFHRVAYGGWGFAFFLTSADYPPLLLLLLTLFLVFVIVQSLPAAFMGCLLGAAVAGSLAATGYLPARLGSEIPLLPDPELKLKLLAQRIRFLEDYSPYVHVEERRRLIEEDYGRMRGYLAQLQEVEKENLVESYFWCVKGMYQCSEIDSKKSGELTFPVDSLVLRDCEDLIDDGIYLLGAHKGVTTVHLGAKGKPCDYLLDPDNFNNLFVDIKHLHLFEPEENFLIGVADKLETLHIRTKSLNSVLGASVARVKNLKKLSISTRKVSAGSINHILSSLKSLKVLELRGRAFRPDILKNVDYPDLEKLQFGPGSLVDLEILKSLKKKNIEQLILYSNSLKKSAVEEVFKDSRLAQIDIEIRKVRTVKDIPQNLPDMLKSSIKASLESELDY